MMVYFKDGNEVVNFCYTKLSLAAVWRKISWRKNEDKETLLGS